MLFADLTLGALNWGCLLLVVLVCICACCLCGLPSCAELCLV